ncbi:hypothetical protein IAT40_000205 [Kwoniella sp. CBS 6097]
MGDFISSGLGSELGDSEIVVASQKPIWHLVPLPLSQIRPSALKSLSIRGTVPSLHSSCLSAISRNLHNYTLASFEGIPPLLIRRIISRIRADRSYEEDCEDRTISNPDEATIWALAGLLDPQGLINDQGPGEGGRQGGKDFTLGVSNASVLGHLTPNPLLKHPDHPLVELPRLYQSLHPSLRCSVSLLTTLTLDGMDGVVNDQNIQSLRYCTHLTVLWMKGCRITDSGIRLLTSSLELPGLNEPTTTSTEGIGEKRTATADEEIKDGRGLWRLRAWSVSGCKGVGDRSMNRFARLPGLVMLDIRDTSCTTSAIDIFNRTSQNLFSGANADLQPCTEGLLSLFARYASSAEILDLLRKSLIKPKPTQPLGPPSSDLQISSDVVGGRQDPSHHIALHVVPSAKPLQERWLPTTSLPIAKRPGYSSYHEPKDAKTVYRSNGVGQIYGSSVSSVMDEAKDYRRRIITSMQIQYEKEHAVAEKAAYDNMSTVEKRKYTMEKNRQEKEDREYIKYGNIPEREKKVVAGRIVKPSRKVVYTDSKSDEKSKKFVKGSQGAFEQGQEEDGLDGERKLMLVRMVNEDWENLTWTTNTGSTDGMKSGIGSQLMAGGTEQTGSWGRAASQRLRANNLVEQLLSSTQTQSQSQSQSQRVPFSFSSPDPSPSQASASASSSSSRSISRPDIATTTTYHSNIPSTPVKSEHEHEHEHENEYEYCHGTSRPSSSTPAQSSSQSQKPRVNPFKTGMTTSSTMGVRPLSRLVGTPTSEPHSQPQAYSNTSRPSAFSQQRSNTTSTRDSQDIRSATQKPFSPFTATQTQGRNLDFVITGEVEKEDGLSFNSVGRKRTFGGGTAIGDGQGHGPVEPKRRGMKMFSIGANRGSL